MRKPVTVAALALAVALVTCFTLGAIASAARGPSAAVVRAQQGHAAIPSRAVRSASRSAQSNADSTGSEVENGTDSESENGATGEETPTRTRRARTSTTSARQAATRPTAGSPEHGDASEVVGTVPLLTPRSWPRPGKALSG